MPDRPAYTVSPVVTTNDQGQEVISDLSVSSGHASALSRDGQVQGWQMDFIEDSEGRIHHVFENVELDEDQGNSFDEDAYIEALYEANGGELEQAIAWGTENLPESLLEWYNQKIDGDGLDDLNEAVQWILDQYRNREDYEPPQESEETTDEESSLQDKIDALNEEETAFLVEAIDTLTETEPAGDEIADQWQEQVEIAQQSGDETYALVCAATAAVHSGECSPSEAVQFAMENCDLQDLARVYRHLMNQ